MKKNLFVAACLSLAGLAGFSQTQFNNASFETWTKQTCGTNEYEEPQGVTSFIGSCIEVSTNVEKIYALDLHTFKVDGATTGSKALKLVNTKGSGSAVNSYACLGITTGITKISDLVELSFKSDIQSNDTMSISVFAYSGDGSMADFMNKMSSLTHYATVSLSAANNKTTFSKLVIPFDKTGTSGTPNTIVYMVNTKGNKAQSYIPNIKSSITIDEIKLKDDVPTATIIVNESIMRLTSDFQGVSLPVSADVAWKASSDASWLKLTKNTGDVGISNLSFALDENTGLERFATITISGEGARSKKIMVFQETGNTSASLGIVEPKFSFSYKAGEKDSIIIKTTSAWKIENVPSWLSLSTTSGTGNKTVILTVQENTGEERSEELSVIVPDVDTQKVEISQNPAKSLLKLSADATSLVLTDISNNTKTVNVTSNTEWYVMKSASWIDVSSIYGYGNSSLKISAMKNTGAERSGVVTLTATGATDVTIKIVQSATGTYIKENPVVTPEEPVVDPQVPGTTSVSDQSIETATVIYPNPANDQFFVKANAKTLVAVYSQSNELLIEKAITSDSAIDISSLSKGSYFVSVTSDDVQYKTILIKQ